MSVSKTEKALKSFIKELFPKIEEEKKYGGVLYKAKSGDTFCGIFSYKNHVSLEFSFGSQLKDTKKLLLGSGKYRRHLKFKCENDISFPILKSYLNEARKQSLV